MHRTQGFGSSGVRGSVVEYFRVLAGAPATTSLFEGLDRSWARVPGSTALDDLLARAADEYQVDRPYDSVPTLTSALAALAAMPDHPWKAHKQQELCDTIAACAAVHASAHVKAGQVTCGSRSELTVNVIARSPVPVTVTSIHLRNAGDITTLSLERSLEENIPIDIDGEVVWSGPAGEANVEVDVALRIGAASFTLRRPVLHSWIDPIVGERWEPIVVVPRVTVNPRLATVFTTGERPRPIEVRLRAFADDVRGVVRVDPPAGAVIEPLEQPFVLAHAGAEQLLSFVVRQAAAGPVRFAVDCEEARELVRLDYPHIPPITMTRTASVELVPVTLARAGDRIGYIAGAGDEVAQALSQVGYQVTMLTDEAIEAGPLSAYDAIVTGVRAFNTSQHLAALMPRLLAFVETGGTLVVQYNTNTMLSALTAAIGPYPFTIGDDRVCDENATVRLRDPEHPIFTWPNRIGADDFAGWVQERGLCFSSTWDRRFTPLLSLHDRGEPPRDGGLLVASHGCGRLVYTGLAFFRQLPAGVPGAFRLFANLLAREART